MVAEFKEESLINDDGPALKNRPAIISKARSAR